MNSVIHRLARRFAASLALAAALSFVLNGALASGHHTASDPGAYHGAHVHFHVSAPADTSDHHHAGSNHDALVTGHHHGPASAPVSGPDAGSECCSGACHIGVMLPCPSAQAEPLALRAMLAKPNWDHGSGFMPDGLRRPPRPGAIT